MGAGAGAGAEAGGAAAYCAGIDAVVAALARLAGEAVGAPPPFRAAEVQAHLHEAMNGLPPRALRNCLKSLAKETRAFAPLVVRVGEASGAAGATSWAFTDAVVKSLAAGASPAEVLRRRALPAAEALGRDAPRAAEPLDADANARLPPGCAVVRGAVPWRREYDELSAAEDELTAALGELGVDTIDGGQANMTFEEQQALLDGVKNPQRRERLKGVQRERNRAIQDACVDQLLDVVTRLVASADPAMVRRGVKLAEMLRPRPGETDQARRERLRAHLGQGTRLATIGGASTFRQGMHVDGDHVSFIVMLTNGAATLVDAGASWTRAGLAAFVRRNEGFDHWRRSDVPVREARSALRWAGPCLLPDAAAAARLRPVAAGLKAGDFQVLDPFTLHAGAPGKRRAVAFLSFSLSGARYNAASHLMNWKLGTGTGDRGSRSAFGSLQAFRRQHLGFRGALSQARPVFCRNRLEPGRRSARGRYR